MYTATTGIWQTVWLEPVSPTHIESLKIVPDVDGGCLRLTVVGSGSVEAVASDDGKDVAQVRARLDNLMGQFAAFDQTLRSAMQANHMMFRPLRNLADMMESLRLSFEQRGNMPAEMMIVRMAADAISGITPNKGVAPESSLAGKVLRNVPRNT